MATIRIEDGWLDIRVGWLERWLLSEKPRRLHVSKVRSVDPHPPLLDMLLYWTDQRGVWLGGATKHEGYLVPSTRNPYSTIAIEVFGQRCWYVELDDQEPVEVAAQIERARLSQSLAATTPGEAQEHPTDAMVESRPRASERRSVGGLMDQHDESERDDEVRLRDPVMQGSLAPPPMPGAERAGEEESAPKNLRPYEDRDLSRLGGWLVAAGVFGMLTGSTIVAAGLLPGLIAVGAGLACAVIGGLTLGLVAHHQG